MKAFTAVSLFCGAGGMDIGFERAGVRILFANDRMPEAAATYAANHAGTVAAGDIHDVIGRTDAYRGADLVFGGPPCQGFSVAGKMDPDDARSKLIFTFLDVVERVRPRAFVMENVKALGKLEKWAGVRGEYLRRASAMGYECVPFLLNAVDFGVSQKRERVFFIGIKGRDAAFKERMERLLLRRREKAPTVRELLFSLGRAGTPSNPDICPAKIVFAARPVMRKSPYAGMYFNGQGRPIDIDGYANTLPASMGGNKTPFLDEEYLYGGAASDWVADYHRDLTAGVLLPQSGEAPERLRRITVQEAARLQSFPDGYVFCGNRGKVYTQIGNAVPSKLAQAVASATIEYLKGTR